jgi:integrase/recombinase XerC/integrase/recombinase XerD
MAHPHPALIRGQWFIVCDTGHARGNAAQVSGPPGPPRGRRSAHVVCDKPEAAAMTRSTGADRPDRDQPAPLAAAAAGFLAQRDLRSRSITVYGQTLARLAAYAGADTPIDQLGEAELQAFMDAYYADAAPATWNLNLAALRSFFGYARRQHATAGDPTGPIERRRLRRDPDRRVIPGRQLDALWRRADLPVRDKTLWRLLYDSAARAHEILGLDVDDLDLPDKTATVTGKGGITRQVNWYTHTAHLLPRLVDGRTHGPLFLANRRPRSPVATVDLDPATGRARLSYRRAAEVFTSATGWTLHQLRHTRIRELKDTGCPLPVLQKITGHRSLRTLTEHYPGPSPQAVQAWYDNTDPDARRPRPG